MSIHPWFDYVVGGVGHSSILKVGDNLCDNPRFSNGSISGWSFNGQWLTEPYVIVDDNAYEEYMGRLNSSDTDSAYALYTKDVGSTLNKSFLVCVRLRSELFDAHDVRVTLQTSDSHQIGTMISQTVVTANKSIKRICLVGKSTLIDNTRIGVRIGTQETLPGDNPDLRFDDVYICEVSDSFALSLTSMKTYLKFDKIVRGQNELFDGKIQEFNKAWRPNYFASWEFMDAENEGMRQKIAEGDRLFVIPHRDFSWGFFGVWDDGFERRYPWNKFLGHAGTVLIKGIEFLKSTIHPISIYATEPVIPDVTVSINAFSDITDPPTQRVVSIDYVIGEIGGSEGNADTPFTLSQPAGVYLKLTAPSTDGLGGIFHHWIDELGYVGNDTRVLVTTFQDGKVWSAMYNAPPPPEYGYGFDYGDSYL
jgi:hypothetical protein